MRFASSMRRTTTLVVLLGLAFAISCSQSLSNSGDRGTGGAGDSTGSGGQLGGDGGSPPGSGGAGGIGGTGGCQSPRYFSAGCNVAPVCPSGAGGACLGWACSCSGKVITGCRNDFGEPYAYTLPTYLDGGGVSYPPGVDASFVSADDGGSHQLVGTCDPNAVP